MKLRKIFIAILTFALLLVSLPTLSISAASSPGQIDLTKTSVISGDREYKVTLTVDGNSLPTAAPADIVLVLDVSTSMSEQLVGGQNPKTRLQVLKSAAQAFVNTVLASGNNRVAVVVYATDVTGGSQWNDGSIVRTFSSNITQVNNAINGVSASGYTNMEAGFYHADAALDSARVGVNKFVVYMTDGVPNRYYSDSGNTSGSGTGFSTTAASQAIGAAEALKANHPGTKIFTIGLINDDPGGQIATVLNPASPHDYPEEFYQVTTANGLSSIYQYLSGVILQIATDAVVTDIIEDGFSYIPSSLTYSTGTASVSGSPATQEVVTWTIGSITDQLLTLSFRVRADDPVFGGAFTNESAELKFKPVPENTFYTPGADGYVSLPFERPVVPVPPIAVDDTYTVATDTVLTVPVSGVLQNDISVDQRADGGWTSTPISGSVVVVGAGPSNGSLVQNADGSLQYTPNAGFSGVDTYVYKISTTVTMAGGGSVVLEDSATVTINVIPAFLIRVHKTDKTSGDDLAGFVYQLYDDSKTTVLETLPETDANGYATTASAYSTGTYYLKESGKINGYELDSTFYPVTIVAGSGTVTIDVADARTPYPIGVYKIDDSTEAPISGVQFGLYSDIDATDLLETLAETDVTGYAQSANAYAPGTYYLKEVAPAGGYLSNNSVWQVVVNVGQANNVATITVSNTKISEIDITVTKIWNDENAQDRPVNGIVVRLMRQITGSPAVEIDHATLNGTGSTWTHIFSDLPTSDVNGNAYSYSVDEDAVSGYTKSINGFTITNTRTGLIDITVDKSWVDSENIFQTRPASIAVHLWRKIATDMDATDLGAVSITANDNWQHQYPQLPKYDAMGREYTYSVTEEPVTNYSAVVEGFLITNTLDTVDITINKVWADSTDAANIRPDSVQVQLYRNGETYLQPVTLSGEGNWTYMFSDLPANDANGAPITYTVQEITLVAGYTTTYSENTLTITNTIIKHRIQIIKLDQRNETSLLTGAIFELHAAVTEGQVPVVGALLETLTTDVNGQAKTANSYAPGNYFLVETKAPAGFLLMSQPILVVMATDSSFANDGTFVVRVYNNFDNNPAIMVSKTVSNLTRDGIPADLATLYVGDTAQYKLVITNTGNAPLVNVTVKDDKAAVGGAVRNVTAATDLIWADSNGQAILNLGTLAAGSSITLTYNYVVKAADLAREPIENTATVSGSLLPTADYPQGTTVTSSDSAMIAVDAMPLAGLAITKRVNNVTRGGFPTELAVGLVGDTFKYTITISNNGGQDITNAILTDSLATVGSTIRNETTSTNLVWTTGVGNIATLNIGLLAKGASVTYTYVYASGQLSANSVRENTAILKGTPAIWNGDAPVSITVQASASISVEEIPTTGESGSMGSILGLALLFGAGALLFFRRRRSTGDAGEIAKSDEI